MSRTDFHSPKKCYDVNAHPQCSELRRRPKCSPTMLRTTAATLPTSHGEFALSAARGHGEQCCARSARDKGAHSGAHRAVGRGTRGERGAIEARSGTTGACPGRAARRVESKQRRLRWARAGGAHSDTSAQISQMAAHEVTHPCTDPQKSPKIRGFVNSGSGRYGSRLRHGTNEYRKIGENHRNGGSGQASSTPRPSNAPAER